MNLKQMGRLAMRVEGRWWVAYYAEPDTMVGALRLAKVHMSMVQDEARKQAYMDLCKSFVSDILQARTGAAPEWSIKSAPESERSGNA